MASTVSTQTGSKRHPPGLYLLFFTEMWERFGFYLILGILVLYMTDKVSGGLKFDDPAANDVYGTYLALVYLTPFIGGLLADRVFGYRLPIVAGGLLMAAGYMCLAIPTTTAFFPALALIILGNGLFKPNISTMLGNLYNKPEYRDLKDKGYNIFYMGINIGAFICNFVAAYLRNSYGWGYAFAAAGVGMLIGVTIFLCGYKRLAEVDQLKPAQPEDMSIGKIFQVIFVPAILFAILGIYLPSIGKYLMPNVFVNDHLFGSTSNDAFLFACLPVAWFYLSTYLKANAEDRPRVGSLLYIFVVVIIFWAVFHQNGNVLTQWAERNTWRELPPSLVAEHDNIGIVETVDDVPGEVRTETIDKLQTHRLEFTAKTAEEASQIAAGLKSGAEIEHLKTKESDTYTVTRPVESRQEGKQLAEQLLASGAVKKLSYNPYLDLLPRSSWPTADRPSHLISSELFQSLNPFFVIIFTPLVVGVFNALGAIGREPSTPAKICIGLFITGLSTLVMLAAGYFSHSGLNGSYVKVSAMWLVGTYAVITIGELCLSPMGLSLVSKLSPPRLTAVMMGGWFVSTSFGNKLSGVLGHIGADSEDKSFVFLINFAGAMVSAVLLLIFVPTIRDILARATKNQ